MGFCRLFPLFYMRARARCANEGGEGRVTTVGGIIRRCVSEIIMTHNTSSVDHLGVKPCNRNCNPAVNPATYVWNGIVHFLCHNSTQTIYYNQGLLSYHTINRDKKRKNVSVACGNNYRYYPSFDYPNKFGAYPFVHFCRCQCTSLQIWRWLWRQSGFTISP